MTDFTPLMIITVALLALVVLLFHFDGIRTECEKAGGELMRGIVGYSCVQKNTIIKLR